MKLGKKTVIFSLVSMLVIVVVFFAYASLLLPNLYTDRATKQAQDEAMAIHKQFIEERSYKNIEPGNWAATFSIMIMKNEPVMKLFRREGEVTIVLKDPEMVALHDKFIRYNEEISDKEGDVDYKPFDEDDFTFLKGLNEDRMEINFISYGKELASNQEQSINTDFFDTESLLMTMSHRDGEQEYVLEIGVTEGEDALMLTYVPVMIGNVNQILPVVWSSLPMVLAVLALLVFISSGFFARSITNPIKKLAENTRRIWHMEEVDSASLVLNRQDEIGELSGDIADMSRRLNEYYRGLKEENLRKEVLLRAVSHQLKTPLSGALLLTDGMMDEVWDESQRVTQLGKLKERLLTMQDMVEQILRLEDKGELEQNEVEMKAFIEQLVQPYQEQCPMDYHIQGEAIWVTDGDLLARLVDNLLSNVHKHGNPEGLVDIHIFDDSLTILNTKSHISEEILPHVMDAFVSKDQDKGRGLGLYLASYDARRLGMILEVKNTDEGVLSLLIRKEGGECI